MSISKKFLILIGFVGALFFSGGYFNIAAAEETDVEQDLLTPKEITSLKSFLNDYEVDIETQNKLIEKLLNGEKWDSLTKKQPVNTYQITTDLKVENVSVFEDGSITVTATDLSEAEIVTNENLIVPNKNNLITPLGIAPGSIVKGSGYAIYYDTKIYVSNGVITAYFYADYELTQGGYSRINSIGGAYRVSIIGGTASDIQTPRIVLSKETANKAAEAIFLWQYTIKGELASTTGWLKLQLKNSKATTPYDI